MGTFSRPVRDRILYLDNVVVGQDVPVGFYNGVPGGILLGKRQTTPIYFVGALDDLRIYTRVLSPAEINTAFTTNVHPSSNLQIYLPFDDMDGTTARDYSTFGRDSTLAGDTRFDLEDPNCLRELILAFSCVTLLLQRIVCASTSSRARMQEHALSSMAMPPARVLQPGPAAAVSWTWTSVPILLHVRPSSSVRTILAASAVLVRSVLASSSIIL